MCAQEADFDPPGPEDEPLLLWDTHREVPAVVAGARDFISKRLAAR
jgi:hypothetical protein